jgi:5-methylcytosine-specific restriction endonuclease McrA
MRMENQGGIAAGEFALDYLSDEALLGELGRVSRAHKLVTAELVAHIAEVDARKLYLVKASPSMFAYCVERLGFSEDEACRRIDAARVGRKWPTILQRIAAGEISLTVVSKLKPFLNDENVGALLSEVAGKSVREAERILAARFPKPDTADSIRKLPGSKGSNVGSSSADAGGVEEREPKTDKDKDKESEANETGGSVRPADMLNATTDSVTRAVAGTNAADATSAKTGPDVMRPVDRGRMQPLSEDRIQVKFTATRALEEKLELARDLMSHSNPRGDLATVIEAALDLLIAERLKAKLGQTNRAQRKARPAKKSRITSATRREVLERDGLACSFVDGEGRRCGARAFLELDHREPKGKGGNGERENVRLLCRAHNQLEAEREYGKAHMERKRNGKGTTLTVRDGGGRERFVVGFCDPRRRGYSSSAGRTNSKSRPAADAKT